MANVQLAVNHTAPRSADGIPSRSLVDDNIVDGPADRNYEGTEVEDTAGASASRGSNMHVDFMTPLDIHEAFGDDAHLFVPALEEPPAIIAVRRH